MRRIVVLVASAALALTVASSAGAATPPPYKVDGALTQVASVPGSDMMWAARESQRIANGLVSFTPGTGWRNYRLPVSGTHVVDIDMVSETAGWAVASDADSHHGYLLRWNGVDWSAAATEALDPVGGFTVVSGAGSAGAWMVGWEGDAHVIWQWDGMTLTRLDPPGGGDSLSDVLALADNDVWVTAMRYRDSALALHYEGTDWSVQTLPTPDGASVIDLAAAPGGDLWGFAIASDTGTLVHRTGESWQSIPMPFAIESWGVWPAMALASNGTIAVSITRHRGGAVYDTTLARYDGAQWSLVKIMNTCQIDRYQLIRDVATDDTGAFYAVGGCYGWRRYTAAYRLDDNQWSRV